ncbi:MAG TPA: hypothetical protein VF686_00735 [Brevundimonas sp.]
MRFLTGAAFCIALGCSTPASAQDTVPLPVRIEGPAHIRLHITKTDRRDAGPEQGAAFTYDVTLSKAQEDTGRREIVWRLTHVDGEGVTPESSPGPDIRMTVDETLTPLSLDNLGEIIASTRRQLERSVDLEASGGALRMLASLTPETAAPLFMADAGMIAVGQGTDLFLGEDSSYEAVGRLPWGGADIIMIGTYRLVEVDRATGKARLQWSQEIDPDSLMEAIPAMIDGIVADKVKQDDSADMAAKIRASLTNATLRNNRSCDFMIDIATGLAEKVDCLTLVEFVAGEETSRRETRLIATQVLTPRS